MSTSPETGGARKAPISLLTHVQGRWAASPPTPLTPLIGREAERARARELVAEGVRLLTLHGPGGIGKTRLAIQIAADLRAEFGDGIAWVPLASVRDADAVLPGIAKTLGIGESPHQPVLTDLRGALRDGQHLLILDNVEQVLAAGGHLAELLASCPGLVMLATSRSLLRIAGEHAIEVPALELPSPSSPAPAGNTESTEAIQLFVSRARAVSQAFRLDEENAGFVADICRQLEGVPLAIEMAAARTNHLSLQSLQSRLHQRLPLLRGGGPDQPARHLTMRDAIAWSYELLTDRQKRLFRRIAVCSGGCRGEAVGTLGENPGDHDPAGAGADQESIDSVAVLVDHSLVRQLPDPDGEPRYSMLQTIREYALEQLDGSGEREDSEARKAAYLTALAERAEFASLMAGGQPLLAILEREDTNIRDTLLWLQQSGQQERALRLAGALALPWTTQGRYREVRSWLAPLLDDRHLGTPRERGRALVGFGYMGIFQRDPPLAEAAFAEALDLAQAAGNPVLTSLALIGSGVTAELRGQYEDAMKLLNEALALSRTLDESSMAASIASSAHANLGVSAHELGQLSLASIHHLQALSLRREVKSTPGICRSLGDLGDVARDLGDYLRALELYRESLAFTADLRDRRLLADLFTGTACVAAAWNEPERAITLLAMADSLRETGGFRILFGFDAFAQERAVAAARKVLDDDAFASAWDAGTVISVDEAIAEVGRIEPPATLHVATDAQQPQAIVRYGLTQREVDVLRGIVDRLTDREIAERLYISPRTVGWHMTGILTKLDVDSRRAAAAKAIAETLT